MKPLARPTLAAIAALAVITGCAALGPRSSGGWMGGAADLRNGAPSVDDLMQELVVAIRRNDEGALRTLRVSEEEYRGVILPGSVAPNETPREYAPKFESYLWGSLDQKNRHSERDLLTAYGGRTLTVEDAVFKRGVKVYRGYTAHSQLDLKLRDDKGADVTFEMGSVAQVGDRYKFISFIRD